MCDESNYVVGVVLGQTKEELLKKNRVHHKIATLYHPQINGSFILRSAQQEEALHRIWYALKRCHFSRVYDHSLPHSRLATGDVEGEWRTRAPIGPS
ncbi:unnamed protein product [Spirodela intermedia]|uniref:Uncharacterized protein n=1 Tax=Spirodela intermedia TaxID=51605 RepID=A0A7I8LHB9_SPIIN|nr:unnamed protein product [Spirodela intermedia]